jgi:4-diphosphocytidyl-2-C-methyl-D-erythritol kinase
MQALYDLSAPAKLNLFLHITGRRPDGYHLLQSAFVLIDWADTIHLELRRDGVISREDVAASDVACGPSAPQIPAPSLPVSAVPTELQHELLPADDLCVRAARALQAASGTKLGVHIRLRKRIPTQAGLGGGSSDAATCLLGLKRLWKLREQLPFLEQIGLKLGADVPFFLRGRNAWVEGVGEQITPLELPAAQFAVVKPALGLSTPTIFAHPLLKRDSEHAIIYGFTAHPYGFGHNDLQPVAELLNPQVTQALDALRGQGFTPRMTGSGSAVFAKVSGDETLAAVPPGWQQKLCCSLSEHPLTGWANGL